MFPRTRPLRWLIAALALASCAAAPAPELRVQRSSNLSHLTGTSRTIQIFLKHRYLQLLPDGTVNGTTDGNSTYTILQRVAYENRKQTTIQGVSTCLFLCMDACGFQYANKDLTDDCLFEENFEVNNYNTYSRIRGEKKTFLALDNLGKPRRTQIPVNRPLANLSRYVLITTKDCDGLKQTQCPPRRHRGKLKRPSPFHRNCQRRVKKQNLKKKKHKKPNKPHVINKKRHPKARRKFENGTTTTTEVYDESTMSTMSTTDAEFFRSGTAQEAVGRA